LSDPKGGSDPKTENTPPPAKPPTLPTPPAPNKAAKVSVEELSAAKAALELEVDKQKKIIDELTTQLKAANDVLEAQSRERLIKDILPRSNFTVEDLAGKGLEELQDIRATLDQAKLPTYKNIHFGPIAADEAKDEGLTVGDLSVATAAKRKAGRP